MTITIEHNISEAKRRIAVLTAEANEARLHNRVAEACAKEARIEALAADCARLGSVCE